MRGHPGPEVALDRGFRLPGEGLQRLLAPARRAQDEDRRVEDALLLVEVGLHVPAGPAELQQAARLHRYRPVAKRAARELARTGGAEPGGVNRAGTAAEVEVAAGVV